MNKIGARDRYQLLMKAGIILTLLIGYGIYNNMDSLRWYFVDLKAYHQTTGRVLSSKIEAGGIHGGWRFNITYRYRVGNQEFVSNRVHFGYQAMADPTYAQNYVEKYPMGKQVVVFYEESNPENSVLEPQVIWNGLLDFYLILSLLPAALFGLALYFRINSKRESVLRQQI